MATDRSVQFSGLTSTVSQERKFRIPSTQRKGKFSQATTTSEMFCKSHKTEKLKQSFPILHLYNIFRIQVEVQWQVNKNKCVIISRLPGDVK